MSTIISLIIENKVDALIAIFFSILALILTYYLFQQGNKKDSASYLPGKILIGISVVALVFGLFLFTTDIGLIILSFYMITFTCGLVSLLTTKILILKTSGADTKQDDQTKIKSSQIDHVMDDPHSIKKDTINPHLPGMNR